MFNLLDGKIQILNQTMINQLLQRTDLSFTSHTSLHFIVFDLLCDRFLFLFVA